MWHGEVITDYRYPALLVAQRCHMLSTVLDGDTIVIIT